MISDELYNAKENIEEFLQARPDVYEELKKPIVFFLAGLDWLRDEIDQKIGEKEAENDVDVEKILPES